VLGMWLAVGCSALGAGPDGELWLTIEENEPDGDHILMTFPASALREPGEPAMLETRSGPVDLRPVARKLWAGQEREWTLPGGEVATLLHAPPTEGQATVVSFGLGGPRGGGLSLSVPLQSDRIAEAQRGVQVELSAELPVDYDDAGCAQLRRSPPMPLVEIVGPKGNGLRVETR
jgi:hypothetical protein